ncbi:ABC transporter ATP-binding protein [Peptococcaceae bacterium SCADC1_2_3]|nr:ABC transporter ATP-binding protein [Peptococcaceae bacterium SCADC1_2_3]KFI35588.1 ABC transporter ATP-binding protein [Peptococcaceae bacterium SCADC1_2_3]KFI37184.1 ABC transporter ATP-binding protein [Peptococcaceae bacterium SCADC1_2_3]
MNNKIISAQGLTKAYRRGSEEIFALKEVSFVVSRGEFVAIVGPSGSGKTTLLNLLGCLDTPAEGNLRINGIEISGLKEKVLVKLRRENIGFIFQQFFLLPTLTVRENIELPLLFSQKSNYKGRIDKITELVGLKARAQHLPHQLSGGEMQRVAIGRALINEPEIILADEPTGNLDSATSQKIYELFQELYNQGLTLIIVTHNIDLAKKAHRVIYLTDGKIG